jgi:hypothetical protein
VHRADNEPNTNYRYFINIRPARNQSLAARPAFIEIRPTGNQALKGH